MSTSAPPAMKQYPRTHILSLPREILTTIILQLNSRSAAALGRTCKQLVKPSEVGIWRSLNLIVPEHYGRSPYYRQCGPDCPPECLVEYLSTCGPLRREASIAEEDRVLETVHLLKKVLLAGNTDRYRLVKYIAIDPVPGTALATLQILGMVQRGLESLVYKGIPYQEHGCNEPSSFDVQFWNLIAKEDLFDHVFPKLTNVDVTLSVRDYQESVDGFLRRAPWIRKIRLDLRATERRACDDNCSCNVRSKNHVPLVTGGFRLRKMESMDVRFIYEWNCGLLPQVIHNLAASANNLEHLRLDCRPEIWESDHRWELKDLLDVISRNSRKQLKRLEWLVEPVEQMLEDEDDCVGPSVFRAVTHGVFVTCIQSHAGMRLEYIPELPTPRIEEVILLLDLMSSDYARTNKPIKQPVRGVFGDEPNQLFGIGISAVKRLKKLKHLRLVQFAPADIEEPKLIPPESWLSRGTRGCVIRSFTHNGEEVFHARTLTFSYRRSVTHYPNNPFKRKCSTTSSSLLTSELLDSDGKSGTLSVLFGVKNTLDWEDATDFQGEIVPLIILKQMRQAAGIQPGEWNGRGFEVGEEVWKVLTDWKEVVDRARVNK